MKVLISLPHGRVENEYIIEQCQHALDGYREDENGDTYFFHAVDDVLIQSYNDEEKKH